MTEKMTEVQPKRRRTSTKHSQTGCKTCKSRHIKCDETRPQCVNCERGSRDCVYATKPPKPSVSPTHLDSRLSALVYNTGDPATTFPFRPDSTPEQQQQQQQQLQVQRHNSLPGPSVSSRNTLPFGETFVYGSAIAHHTQPIERQYDLYGSHGSTSSSTSSSMTQVSGHQTPAIIRNAVLANNVQSRVALHRAIHSFSKDFRLKGQQFTIESMLSPLIYRSNALKHAIFANFILQTEQDPTVPTSNIITPPTPIIDPSSLHVRHYRSAATELSATITNPAYIDSNVAALLFLAFYDVCAGSLEALHTHLRDVSQQIRIRGQTIDTNPLALHTKFLFGLYIRMDIVSANVAGKPSNIDRDICRIVYSGTPITGKHMVPYRIRLELLLAEISVFQYDCSTLLSIDAWDQQQLETLRQKYNSLREQLKQFPEADPELPYFEEAQAGRYLHGAMLPSEMGLPLICSDQEFAQMSLIHAAAVIHLHVVAARHHIILEIPIDETQDVAITACRVISGMSIIDPMEPSANQIWPLVNLSYALTFPSARLWVAEQLESVANRYLSRSARLVAQQVRSATPLFTSMATAFEAQSKPGTFESPTWGQEIDQTYDINENETAYDNATGSPTDRLKTEESDILASDLQDWNTQLQ